jgi:putative copper export protein
VAGGDFAFVPVLLGAVAREHLPDRADVAVVGRDEALARAGFGGAGLADFAVAGLAGVYGGLQDRERLVEVVHGNSALNAGPLVALLSAAWASSDTCRITFSMAFSAKRTPTRGTIIAFSAYTRAVAAVCKASCTG